MICPRCGKACINRTEGRWVRLADKDLFFCNACSLHALAGSEQGDRHGIRVDLKEAPRTGGLGG